MSIGGIDSQLRDTQDGIMSGTRQPLDNRLLDVLALQRIKEAQAKEKEKLLTFMERKEGTVADQLTNEVINNEKEKLQGGIKDIAAQVGATNTQQAQQQQQNLQRVAQQGVATQPAPNMARMAGGGIVAFAEGDKVKGLSNRTPAQLLEEVGITEAQFARMSDQEKAAVFETISRGRRLAREVGTGGGALNTTLAGIYDIASMPVTALGRVLGTAGKATGIMDPQSPDPFQSYTPKGKPTWTPALHAVNRMAQRNQPITRQDLAPRDTKLAGSLGPDLGAISGIVGAPGGQTVVPTSGPTSGPTGGPPPTSLTPESILPPDPTINKDELGIASTVTGPQTRASLNPDYTTGIAANRAAQKRLVDRTDPRISADPEAARKAQFTRADEYTNRAGIANQYKNMLARRQEADRVSGEERDYWALNDMLARAGGQGALSNIARGAADMRTAKREDILRRHDKREALELAGIDTDTKLSVPGLKSGDEAARLTALDRQNAVTAQTKLFGDIGQSLSDEARRGLDVTTANMTAEQADNKIRMQKAVAELGARSRVAVAEYNGKISLQGHKIQEMAVKAKDRATLQRTLVLVDQQLAKVDENIAKSVTDAIVADVNALNLPPKERAAKIKELTETARKANATTRESLLITQELIRDRLLGAFADPSAPPSAKAGFGNRTSTPPGP